MTADVPGRTGAPGARIVVVGKGGVGKSTLSALMARILARSGMTVVAVDADEQQNLAATLGIAPEAGSSIVPVASAVDYVEEKTGARPGEGAGAMLRLNPDTRDLVDRLAVSAPDGVRLLVMGGVGGAGGGCLCPETAVISAAVAGMRLHRDEVVVMDTHAGVEHFGRSLARGFDTAVAVADPSSNALSVATESSRLAYDLGIPTVHLVVNRIRSERDIEWVRRFLAGERGELFRSTTFLPFEAAALDYEPGVEPLFACPGLLAAVTNLTGVLVA